MKTFKLKFILYLCDRNFLTFTYHLNKGYPIMGKKNLRERKTTSDYEGS